MRNYILKDKTPILEPDIIKWGEWYSSAANKHVNRTDLPNDVYVSTVFLGIDHGFLGQGEPILFETMIFGGEHDQYQDRYTTWDEAEKGHEKAINIIFQS